MLESAASLWDNLRGIMSSGYSLYIFMKKIVSNWFAATLLLPQTREN